METLKRSGDFTVELVLRSNGGKQKFTFTAEEPFDAQSAHGIITALAYRAVAKTAEPMKQWQTAQGDRYAVERRIQNEREAFYRIEGQVKQARQKAMRQEAAIKEREVDVAKHAGGSPSPSLTMKQRIAGWASNG